MSRSTPSLLALLGLVAVAGYQNRGKISEMLSDAQQGSPDAGPDGQRTGKPEGNGGFLSEIRNLFEGGASGGTLSAGLADLVTRFRDSGRAAPADSWVSKEPNIQTDVSDLEAAIGDETLNELGQKTGLSRDELLHRLNAGLPEFVNRFTPEGHIPSESEARRFD